MFEPHEILELFESQRKKLHLSQAEVNRRAFGKPDTTAIQSLKKGASPGIDRVAALAGVLDLELYLGPPRDIAGAPQPPASDPAELADIPLYNAGLAAGAGVANGDGEIVDYLAFRRDWLRTIGVAPSNAVMARIKGESMQPTIRSGDMVLIDTSKVEIQSRGHTRKTSKPHVYAFVESGEARVKRIERVETDFYAVISDNDAEFPIEFKTGKALHDMHIIGRVMWWAHTDRG